MDERKRLTEWKSYGAGFTQLAVDARQCLTQPSLVLLMLGGGLQMAMCESVTARVHSRVPCQIICSVFLAARILTL
jgi:hypothetical protein